MRPHTASLFDFDLYEPLPIQIEVSDTLLTSDAGLLPLRQFSAKATSDENDKLTGPQDGRLFMVISGTRHLFREMLHEHIC
ncbi:MAG TPA: hypothetical protein VK395_32990 [Gemmataceae bacterium]|nr:hypothetical protein [Gemmataceae bacterium]